MKKAVFLDFYGTVVYEDGEIIRQITQVICQTGCEADPAKVGGFWWKVFQDLCAHAYGDTFQTQRELEIQSLTRTLEKFHANADPFQLSEWMFTYWRKPPIFEDSKVFFSQCSIPIHILSNIDTEDIKQALVYYNLVPEKVWTSEDVRSYKPRKEMFEQALRASGLQPDEVVHIGDSLSSDVKGAQACQIPAIWLNRSQRSVPWGVTAVSDLIQILDRYL